MCFKKYTSLLLIKLNLLKKVKNNSNKRIKCMKKNKKRKEGEKKVKRGKKERECIELTWFSLKLPKSIDKMTWLKATYYWK